MNKDNPKKLKLRFVNIGFALLYIMAIGLVVPEQIRAQAYLSCGLVCSGLGIVMAGHLLQKRWAAQVTTFLLMGVNIYAIFYFFPPFADDSPMPMDVRVLGFVTVFMVCTGLCMALYFLQKFPTK